MPVLQPPQFQGQAAPPVFQPVPVQRSGQLLNRERLAGSRFLFFTAGCSLLSSCRSRNKSRTARRQRKQINSDHIIRLKLFADIGKNSSTRKNNKMKNSRYAQGNLPVRQSVPLRHECFPSITDVQAALCLLHCFFNAVGSVISPCRPAGSPYPAFQNRPALSGPSPEPPDRKELFHPPADRSVPSFFPAAFFPAAAA